MPPVQPFLALVFVFIFIPHDFSPFYFHRLRAKHSAFVPIQEARMLM
jgi:hypothetical protein